MSHAVAGSHERSTARSIGSQSWRESLAVRGRNFNSENMNGVFGRDSLEEKDSHDFSEKMRYTLFHRIRDTTVAVRAKEITYAAALNP